DAAARRDADEAHVAPRPVAQHFRDAALHLAGDVHAARTAVDVAEGEAGIGDRRIVEDWHEARRVGHHGAVEERFVSVSKANQIDVTFQIRRLRLEVSRNALDLSVEGLYRMR